MQENLSDVRVAGQARAKFLGIAPGEEKFAFLYVVIAVAAVAWATTYSWIARLTWRQGVPLVIGCVVAGCAVIFTVLEVRRLAQTPKQRADQALQQEPDPYAPRTVVVLPETGEGCVHHENYPESPGLDQGQLTSQLSGSTPFVDRFLSRRSKKPA